MSVPNQTRHREASLLTFLDFAGWMAFIGAILYTAGWSYAYHYFDRFHVGLLALEIPLQYYFIYSFWVLKHHLVWCIGIGVPLWGGLLWVRSAHPRTQRWRYGGQVALRIVFPVLLLLVFWSSYQAGRQTAVAHFYRQRRADYPDYPRVAVQLKAPSPGTAPAPQEIAFEHGCYRLLLQNRDKLFLFYSIDQVPTADLPAVVISSTQTASVTILPHYNSCGGTP